MDRRAFISRTAAAAAVPTVSALSTSAQAQARPADVLVVANEFGPNSLDIHTVGANRPAYGVSWLCYDRLMTYAKKKLPDGRVMYDMDKLVPELAESWKIAPDGNSVTFKLRKNAKFHDGTPVTAKDVKWSFDRAVTVGGFPCDGAICCAPTPMSNWCISRFYVRRTNSISPRRRNCR